MNRYETELRNRVKWELTR